MDFIKNQKYLYLIQLFPNDFLNSMAIYGVIWYNLIEIITNDEKLLSNQY